MTATTAAPAERQVRRAAFALPGPYRAVLRQHRTALWVLFGLFAVGIAALAADRLWVGHAADVFTATECSITNTTPGCGGEVRGYLDAELQFDRNLDYAGMAMLGLPCLIGAFVAGPIVARDLESGTYKWAWTQSVTPARWLGARLAVVAALVVSGVVLFTAVQRWAWTTGPELEYGRGAWYEQAMYGSLGTVGIGYALLGLAVGALAGLVIRRVLPAMAAATAVTAGVVVLLPLVRSHLWATETATWARTYSGAATPDFGLLLEHGMLTADGERLPESLCWGPDPKGCMTEHQVTGWYSDFHPSSHFWPLQLVETGILLLLAAAVTYAAFRLLRRRVA
ncbi:ABC transporter permease [Streptomyces venezuelae]|uniref:ABC transporter permease n=1 Tax=Streptomyces venezuelae TaxID=54571 RepID=UPI0037BDEE06